MQQYAHQVISVVSEAWRTFKLIKRFLISLARKCQMKGVPVHIWVRHSSLFAVCERHSLENQTATIAPFRKPPLFASRFPSAQSKLTEEYGHERKQRDGEIPRAVLFNHELWYNSNRQGLSREQGWRINMCLWENAHMHTCTHLHTHTLTHSNTHRASLGWDIESSGPFRLRGGGKTENGNLEWERTTKRGGGKEKERESKTMQRNKIWPWQFPFEPAHHPTRPHYYLRLLLYSLIHNDLLKDTTLCDNLRKQTSSL